MATECVFCRSVHPFAPDGRFTIYETETIAVSHFFRGGEPTYLGQLALQSKRHVHAFADLSEEEATDLGNGLTQVGRALRECTQAANMYAVYFAEVVPHMHVLLTARYPGLPEQYLRMDILDWPEAPRGDEAVVVQLCAELRAFLDQKS